MEDRNQAMSAGRLVTVVALVATMAGCTSEPAVSGGAGTADLHEAHAAAPGAAPENLPLKTIMQGLETDMAALAHALWLEDAAGVAAAAARVADHPRVTPEQMAIIQGTLGPDFAAFVEHDHAVHGATVDLASAASKGATPAELLAGTVVIQEGCVACHTAFRAKVSEALTPPRAAR